MPISKNPGRSGGPTFERPTAFPRNEGAVERKYVSQDPFTGVVTCELTFRNRLLHRDPGDGPAGIVRDNRLGTTIREEYWNNGRLHRDPRDGPAYVERDTDSAAVIVEEYYWMGTLHRDPADGPAVVIRSPDGKVAICEEYVSHGIADRDPTVGPAIIARDCHSGSITLESFWLGGEEIKRPIWPRKHRAAARAYKAAKRHSPK